MVYAFCNRVYYWIAYVLKPVNVYLRRVKTNVAWLSARRLILRLHCWYYRDQTDIRVGEETFHACLRLLIDSLRVENFFAFSSGSTSSTTENKVTYRKWMTNILFYYNNNKGLFTIMYLTLKIISNICCLSWLSDICFTTDGDLNTHKE